MLRRTATVSAVVGAATLLAIPAAHAAPVESKAGGSARSYKFMVPGAVWDTCSYQTEWNWEALQQLVTGVTPGKTITYSGNFPSQFKREFKIAFKKLKQATGYKFVRVSGARQQNHWTFTTKVIGGNTSRGLAGPRISTTPSGRYMLQTANIQLWLSKGVPFNTRTTLIMHEMGHALGLSHVNDSRQIMTPIATNRPPVWGAGDRAGLKKLAKKPGCRLSVGDAY